VIPLTVENCELVNGPLDGTVYPMPTAAQSLIVPRPYSSACQVYKRRKTDSHKFDFVGFESHEPWE
jgi:hypothetical protein